MAVTRKCACGEHFITDAMNRFRCYNCSPARIKEKKKVPGTRPEIPKPEIAPEIPRIPRGKLELRIHSRLDEMDLLEDWRAELVLGLAKDLDSPEVTGAPRTSMTKQLYALMAEFEGQRPPAADDLDDMADQVKRLKGL